MITKLVKTPEWAPHRDKWLEAYQNYRKYEGSPFALKPYDFGLDVASRQYELYDKAKRSRPLMRIRRQKDLPSCPVCGSPVTGQLDHYLPRSVYPEFAVMRANLVPACTHCNSEVKGKTIHGDEPRRFIHPYFDQWASNALWLVDILPPFEAATFQAIPSPQLGSICEEIVRFHLENVLGDQFERSIANEWSTYPLQIKLRIPAPQLDDVIHQVQTDLNVATICKGQNSWLAAFFRGLVSNADALQYIWDRSLVAILP